MSGDEGATLGKEEEALDEGGLTHGDGDAILGGRVGGETFLIFLLQGISETSSLLNNSLSTIGAL